jgi:diguanylate cyclase (GGDEF)-like protein/putative nucleotidyltransferase with HDIG domain
MASLDGPEGERHPQNAKGRTLHIALASIALLLLCISINQISTSNLYLLLLLPPLAMISGLVSGRRRLPGGDISVLLSESLVLLGVMMLGAYHGVLLAVVATWATGYRLKKRPEAYLLSISTWTISVFVSGRIYYALIDYLATNPLPAMFGPALGYALPLAALASARYAISAIIAAAIAKAHGNAARAELTETLPGKLTSYFACAVGASLFNNSLLYLGAVTTTVMMAMVLPLPIIIYYTFRTYRDKLGEQERHYHEVTSIYDSILEMLAMAIDAKDDVTHDHIQRVKLFARRLGEICGLSSLEIEALKAGALLHDIGKIGVPAYILNKPGKLTQHEFEQMKLHTIIGADMLSNIDFRYPVVPIVRHHHERWDGRGYPDGLAAEQIPLTARILTLVDNYDALRSDRPYKTGMSRDEALAYIKANAGTFFDPNLVETFLSVIDDLESEAAKIKSQPALKPAKSNPPALASAKPAAGLDSSPQIDRAAAALNSIAETNQRVTALYEMSRTLSSILSVEDTVAILANRLSKLVPFTTCVITLFDATRSEFEVVHAVGKHSEKFLRRRQPAEAGITGYVITNQRAMYNTNAVLDLGFLGQEMASEYKGVIVYPLVKNQEAMGAIGLYSTEIESYGSDYIQLMESVAQPASDAVYNAIAFEQAQRAAFTDPVTGLASLRTLSAQFERERARSQRLGMPLSLLAISIDSFAQPDLKAIHEREHVLTMLGKLIRQQLRETDLVARHGTTAFIALLPDSGQAEANEVRDRICKAIATAPLDRKVEISSGTATSPGNGNTFEELIQSAQIESIASRESEDMLAPILKNLLSGGAM